MKKALCILDDKLQEIGYTPGDEYEFVGNIHDEFQIVCHIDCAHSVGEHAVDSIREAGEYFNFKCPLDGEYKIGANWSETH